MDEQSATPHTRNLSNRHPNSPLRKVSAAVYSSVGWLIHTFLSDSGQLWTRLRNPSDSHTTRVTGAFSPSKLSSPQPQQHRKLQSSRNLLHREPKYCLYSRSPEGSRYMIKGPRQPCVRISHRYRLRLSWSSQPRR